MRYDQASSNTDPLLTEIDAARLLKVSARTLQAWRGRGRGPAFVRAGRAIRYTRADLTDWVSAQTVPGGIIGRQP